MPDSDKSGKDRIARNVLTSWLCQLVFVSFGFVMPRMIHDSVGQATLGVWDLAWSIVSYMSLAMLGISSSVNRYVARYRTTENYKALSSAISSVMAIQLCIGSSVFLLSFTLSRIVPTFLAEQLGDNADVAGDVIFYLGTALAVQMVFDVFRGILTGCHRWTIHNVLNAGGYSVAAFGMLTVLFNGGGLRGMAITYLAATFATELVRLRIARTVCPEIDLRFSLVKASAARKMFRFGAKTILLFLPKMVVQHTVTFFVVSILGPVTLTILMRPLALSAHVGAMVSKFAFVLTPTSGSMQAKGSKEEMKQFSFMSMRVGWILAILPAVFLVVLGDKVIDLWMGPGYADWKVITILAGGTLLPISQRALLSIMVGMDEHGRIAKYNLVFSLAVLVFGVLIAQFVGWSLHYAAWMIIIPGNIHGILSLFIGCRTLNVTVAEYFANVLKDPIYLLVLTATGLSIARYFGPQEDLPILGIGALVVCVIAGLLLWRDIRDALRLLRGPGKTVKSTAPDSIDVDEII